MTVTPGNVSEAFVSSGSTIPFARQTNVNGPVPDVAVLNVTLSPTQRVAPESAVAAVNSRTRSAAAFVTALHRPVTSTE